MRPYLYLILVILFPYTVVLALLCIFMEISIFRSIMEVIFQNNALLLLLALLIFYVIAFICSLVTLATSIVKERDGRELLRVNMIIKLLHIPGYLMIFIAGFVFLLTIFTFPIALVLMMLSGMAIFLTGLIGLGGILRSFREKRLSKNEAILHSFLQFVFCADIISSIYLYRKTKP